MRRTSSSSSANNYASASNTSSTSGSSSLSAPSTSSSNTASTSLPQSTVASVHFKVRCETLGHGEDVYMVPLEDDEDLSTTTKLDASHRHKMIPLYTTAQSYPWYSTLNSLAMPVSNNALEDAAQSPQQSPQRQLFQAYRHSQKKPQTTEFKYRYAIFRAGVFHRWEKDEDENFVSTSNEDDPDTLQHTKENAHHSDTDSDTALANQSDAMVLEDATKLDYHVLPLRFLHPAETYIVNDVLGKRKGQKPDIYHKRQLHTGNHTYVGVQGSGAEAAKPSTAAATTTPTASSSTKKVGFAVPPPTGRHRSNSLSTKALPTSPKPSSRNDIQLNATDGLVVVSAFLPVVVHRDETSQVPKWSADWDYEALLSMQTHLRVTRVGVVKWKGWHGNYNANNNNSGKEEEKQGQSEHYGVPIEERHLVEECLRPFNCVPVWIDPLIFGEM